MVSRMATRQWRTTDGRGKASGQARPLRVHRGLPNGRAVVGGLLIAVAAVGTFAAYTAATADHRVGYVVARQSLTVGERVVAADLTVAPMTLSPQIASRWAFRNPSGLVGTIVVAPLAAGELVEASDLVTGTGAPGQEEMSFAISASDALDGTLSPGDRVNVLATYGSGSQAQTVTVMTNAPVLAQTAGASGLGANGNGDETLTLGISGPTQSLALAHAVTTGQVIVVRVTGSSGSGVSGFGSSGVGSSGSNGSGSTVGPGQS